MADFPLAAPIPTPSVTAAPSVAGGATTVQVSITTLPSALDELLRALQITATPVATSESTLVLTTELGNVTVSIAQQLGPAEKQSLMQQLISFVRIQKPLTLTLQPGSPPTQGVLIIPSAPSAPQPQTSATPAKTPPLPLSAGTDLRAIVLAAPTAVDIEAGKILPDRQMTIANDRELQKPLQSETQPRNAETPAPRPEAQRQYVPYDATITFAPPAKSGQPQAQPPKPPIASLRAEGLAAAPIEDQAPICFMPRILKLPDLPPARSVPSSPQTIIALQETTSSPAPITTQPQPSVSPPLENVQPVIIEPVVAAPSAPSQAPTTASPRAETIPSFVASIPESSPQQLPKTTLQEPTKTTLLPAQKPPIEALLTPGNEISLRVETVLPQTAEASPPPQLHPHQILAKVSGTGTDGQLILKAEDVTLFVKTEAVAPAGTSLILSIDAPEDDSLITAPLSQRLNFEALPQALAALEQINPQIFHNVVSNFLPQPTESLTGALLFLFSAFKKGNVKDWFGGNAVETLENAGKSSIIGSLSKDLSSAGQKVQDPIVGEWKSYPIPLYAFNQFQELTLHVHADRDARKDKDAREIGKIRFLIDVKLSRLGAMQIDGFVQPKKLDMVLRSENVLPEGLHQDLRAAYAKALGAVGYAGSLNFQVGRQRWVVLSNSSLKGVVT
ncbi:MAG: hypothetical protein PHW76_08620 [Alphaproteobacteria bacterium]|nr:hypothetical protein [Alphaproteobacteria bacterium]